MTIDSNIPLMAKGIDGLQMYKDGTQLGNMLTQQNVSQKMQDLYNQTGGDQTKMLDLVKGSKFFALVAPQIIQQRQALQKMALDNQKTQSEITKNQGASAKDFASADNDIQKTGSARYTSLQPVWENIASSGNVGYGMKTLDDLKSSKAIDDNTYNSGVAHLNSLNGMSPDALKDYAFKTAKNNLDPKYNYQTQDNFATNQQSNINNQRTTDATLHGIDTVASTAANKLVQDQKQFDAKEYIEKNKPLDYFTANNGIRYAVYAGGKGIPITDSNSGQALKAEQKGKNDKLTDGSLKMVSEANTQLSQVRQSYNNVGNLVLDIQHGKLDLNPINLALASGRSSSGKATSNDLAIGRFHTVLNQAANDVLMAAKGTQTEGDAKRAIQTIIDNPPRDNQSAMQALNTLAGIQRNTINTLNNNIDMVYKNSNIQRPDANSSIQLPKPQHSNPPGKVFSQSDVIRYSKESKIPIDEVRQKIINSGGTIR